MAIRRTRSAQKQERVRIRRAQLTAVKGLRRLAAEMGMHGQKTWKRTVSFAVRLLVAATKPPKRREPAR